MSRATFEPILTYPPVGELRESMADLADFVHVEEGADGQITIFAEREADGVDAYRVRLTAASRALAWHALGPIRQALRGGFHQFEGPEGITWRTD